MTDNAAEIAAPAPRGRWPLAVVVWIDLAIVVALVMLTSALVQGLGLGIAMRAQGLTPEQVRGMDEAGLLRLLGIRWIFISTLLQNLIFIAVPLVRVRLLRRSPLASIGIHLPTWPILIGASVGVGILALFINIGLGLFFSQVLHIEQNQSAQFGALISRGDYFGQLLFAIMVIVIAPLGEETLFRGYLFHALRGSDRSWQVGLAMAFSAGLFSAVHLFNVTQGQIALVVPIFLLGLMFAGGAYLTKSIFPGIIAHMMFNSLGVLGLLVCVNVPALGCPI